MSGGAWPGATVLVGAVLLMAGCGQDPADTAEEASPSPPAEEADGAEEVDTTEELTVDGQARRYRLYVPGSAADTSPVVVMLHDAGGTPESMAETTQFDRAARDGGFAVAYPESVRGTWNAGFCCGDAPAEEIDDMAFLEGLVEALTDRGRIDGDRVYLAGVSNGAVMAYRFACESDTPIAGLASVAGAMVTEGCEPSAPLSVLEIHGTDDEVVPFEGGELADFTQASETVPSSEELAGYWADANGCEESATETEDPVTTTTWEECREDRAVRLIAIEGAGHTWYAPGFGPANGAVDATAAIVDFLGLGQGG